MSKSRNEFQPNSGIFKFFTLEFGAHFSSLNFFLIPRIRKNQSKEPKMLKVAAYTMLFTLKFASLASSLNGPSKNKNESCSAVERLHDTIRPVINAPKVQYSKCLNGLYGSCPKLFKYL